MPFVTLAAVAVQHVVGAASQKEDATTEREAVLTSVPKMKCPSGVQHYRLLLISGPIGTRTSCEVTERSAFSLERCWIASCHASDTCIRMLVPALDVSWGGYTITLTAIFGLSTLVQWSNQWDFFINLSASDFPLVPQVVFVVRGRTWTISSSTYSRCTIHVTRDLLAFTRPFCNQS